MERWRAVAHGAELTRVVVGDQRLLFGGVRSGMRKALYGAVVALALLALPFVVRWCYRQVTALPPVVTIATGPAGGAYRNLAESLKRELEAAHPVRVRLTHTDGSAENLQCLDEGQVDFALAMGVPSRRDPAKKQNSYSRIAFVANTYSEVVHLVVRAGAGIETATDLKSARIALGELNSGNHAMASLILDHCGLQEADIQPVFCSYRRTVDKMRQGDVDAAILTMGVRAPVLRELAESGVCRILSIPYARALSAEHLLLAHLTVPPGRYRGLPRAFPVQEIETVAVRAQLLTRKAVPENLVKAVTAIVLNAGFQQRNELTELSRGKRQFAQDAPWFEVHPGVQEYYNPEFEPLLDPDFVEATEGMRSFLVSLLIAAYLVWRWWKERRDRQDEHRLDEFFRALLEIENQQIDIDSVADVSQTEVLEKMLDQVTLLRQEALKNFSAHELKDDRAADCFLEMCHAISDKIGGKLLRQRVIQGFAEGRTPSDTPASTQEDGLPRQD